MISFLSGVIIVNSPYLTPVTQWVLRNTVLPELHVKQVSYHYPFHFKFEQCRLNRTSPLIQTLDIWLNPYQSNRHQLVLDSVLLNGVDLTDGKTIKLSDGTPNRLKINQLAAKNVSFSGDEGVSIQGIDFQVNSPQWDDTSQLIPYGKVQFFAKRLKYRGEQVSQLLLTGDYQKNHSLIQGLSFSWREASMSIQARQTSNHWTITNLTVEKLNLSLAQVHQLLDKFRGMTLLSKIRQLERVDILNSQFTSPQLQLSDFDLSASHFIFKQPRFIWNQPHAALSLDAESITVAGRQWVEPNINIDFTPNQVHVTDFNTSLMDGDIHFSGSFTPETAHIEDLRILGVKLFIEQKNNQPEDNQPENNQPSEITWIQSLLPSLQSLSINQLRIRHSQIIQLAHKPYWQLSGINADVTHAHILSQHQWRLSSGAIRISANNLSYDKFIATQGLLEMHGQDDTWYLDQLFIPFREEGYLKAKGTWKFAAAGAPWQLALDADSLPLKLLQHLPYTLNGKADISLSVHGLSGDSVILGHTLTGQLNLAIRDGSIQFPQAPALTLNFSMEPADISSDRGVIHIPDIQLEDSKNTDNKNTKATVNGEWDFTQPEGLRRIILSVQEGSRQHQYDLYPIHP
jgi:hypothetical protein